MKNTQTNTYLLNVAVEAEEVEDAGAVHLGWMEATYHGNRTGGMARVWRGWLRQWIRHHVWNVQWSELVPAVAGQWQQGTWWTWEGTHQNSRCLARTMKACLHQSNSEPLHAPQVNKWAHTHSQHVIGMEALYCEWWIKVCQSKLWGDHHNDKCINKTNQTLKSPPTKQQHRKTTENEKRIDALLWLWMTCPSFEMCHHLWISVGLG